MKLNMMKNLTLFLIVFLIYGIKINPVHAQTSGASNVIVAQPIPDRTVSFDVTSPGVAKPINWGVDLAWFSETNVRRSVAFMGVDEVDIVRVSFMPLGPIVDGKLDSFPEARLDARLDIIDNFIGTNPVLMLNSNSPEIDPYFTDESGSLVPARWAELIDVTAEYCQNRGYSISSAAPFNEPDYGQIGTIDDLYAIAGELQNLPRFDSIRISGAFTLNCDEALNWYDPLKDRLQEGGTHQLAGSFNNYASFFETVRANGDHASNDELHNVMEAIVGVEYGLQTGIWWGAASRARGELVKASNGERLAYSEHRDNWTAAAVYRNPDGLIQAFGGTSERQAAATTYRFVSRDRDVYYDGHGPQREYTMVMPGGTGYQNGQTNAEKVVNITWGEDVQPALDGRYIIVNRNSGKVLEVAGGSSVEGANIQQGTNTGALYQQWDVQPVVSRNGAGDFSYYELTAAHNGMVPDLYGSSLNDGGDIFAWENAQGQNQQWYVEYVEDGWFYIRNRHSAKCMDVENSSSAEGADVHQWEKNSNTSQQWRFVPVDATIEFNAPAAPSNLTAIANPQSIRLEWTESSDSDVSGYTIFRSESPNGSYNTIARNVPTAFFVDNKTTSGETYYYAIKAVDQALNRSGYSNQTSAMITGANDMVIHLAFDQNTLDSTINLNHASASEGISYTAGNVGAGSAITLNGTNSFVQLPTALANQEEITVATWVYWNGGTAWQRIFDFGNNQNEYMLLSPQTSSGELSFSIRNNGSRQSINAPALPTEEWSHVAVTLGASGASMYVNGELVASSATAMTARPLDFRPIFNYIGRSQYSNDALFDGSIDDFRVYNYVLNASEIAALLENESEKNEVWLEAECGNLGSLWDNVSDASASNGSYITVQSGNNSTGSAPSNSNGYSVYDFNIEIAAVYNLWARVITPNVEDDSFWIKVDDGSWFQWNQIGPNNDWAWEMSQSYDLSEGDHTLTIAYREDGAKLDKLYFGNVDPLGEGLASSNCGQASIRKTDFLTSEEEHDMGITVFPNPMEEELSIAIDHYRGQVDVEIYGIDGSLQRQLIEYINLSGTIVIPRWGYKGLGFVRVTAGQEVKVLKIIF